MQPEMAPYALTTMALAVFALAVAHVRLRPTRVDVGWTWAVGLFLIACCTHMVFAPIHADHGESTRYAGIHAFLRFVFMLIALVGVPSVINTAVESERP